MEIKNREEFEELVAIRRDFHRYPEVSGKEFNTMEKICGYLTEWGIPFEKGVAETGVVATVTGMKTLADGSAAPVVAIRADIDALPIQEENPHLDFASEIKGVMHACGHDIHTAIALGTARRMKQLGENLPGTVKFFFQPNEEDTGGAARMIAAGCLENPHVDAVLGLHVAGDFKVGEMALKYGKMYAASDMITLDVYGSSAHGAQPSKGIDAITVTMAIVNAVQTIVSRNTSATDSAVITFGTINGGNVRNQLADHVNLGGIIRTLDDETRKLTKERLKNICEGVAESMGARAELRIDESYRSLINTDWVCDVVKETGENVLGKQNVFLETEADMGTEDFSYYAAERPACFFHIGTLSEEETRCTILHNCHFDPDERCIAEGVELQSANAVAVLKKLAELKSANS